MKIRTNTEKYKLTDKYKHTEIQIERQIQKTHSLMAIRLAHQLKVIRSGGVRLTTLVVLSLPEIGWIPAGRHFGQNPIALASLPYHGISLVTLPYALDFGQPRHITAFSFHLLLGLASPPVFVLYAFHVSGMV